VHLLLRRETLQAQLWLRNLIDSSHVPHGWRIPPTTKFGLNRVVPLYSRGMYLRRNSWRSAGFRGVVASEESPETVRTVRMPRHLILWRQSCFRIRSHPRGRLNRTIADALIFPTNGGPVMRAGIPTALFTACSLSVVSAVSAQPVVPPPAPVVGAPDVLGVGPDEEVLVREYVIRRRPAPAPVWLLRQPS
jgi:hypothetical protein